MNQKHIMEKKQAIYKRYRNGESVSTITADSGIPRSTIYAWIRQFSKSKNQNKEISARNFKLLENKVAHLEGIIEIIHKAHCFESNPLEVKLPAMEALYGQYSVHMLCDALKVPRGTFYNHIFRSKKKILRIQNAGRSFDR